MAHAAAPYHRENARAILRRSPGSVNRSPGLVGDQVPALRLVIIGCVTSGVLILFVVSVSFVVCLVVVPLCRLSQCVAPSVAVGPPFCFCLTCAQVRLCLRPHASLLAFGGCSTFSLSLSPMIHGSNSGVLVEPTALTTRLPLAAVLWC